MKKEILFICLFSLTSCINKEKKTSASRLTKGETLFMNTGCVQCHSLNGKKMYGPSLNNILNTTVRVIGTDSIVKAKQIDRDYILKSIKYPDLEKSVEYLESKMPKPELRNEEFEVLADYIIYINQNKKSK